MAKRISVLFLSFLFVNTSYAVPSINESNDYLSSFISPADSNYTQGLEISSTKSYKDAPCILQNLAARLPEFCFGISCDVRSEPDYIGFGVLQDIFTPHSRDEKDPVPNEDPYAGYLAMRLTRLNQDEHYRISTSLYLGMVGPWSFAHETQDWFHDLIRNKKFQGWSHQLHNEPAFYFNYKRGFVDYKKGSYAGIMMLTDEEINLGTVYTDIAFRKEFRIGYNLQGYNLENKHLSIYVFTHPEIKGILRNLFLDGNTFEKSAHVDTENFQAVIDSGIVVEWYGWQVTYHMNWSTKDYSQQEHKIHGYAGIKIEKLFED